MMTEDAVFYLDGKLQKQNCRVRGEENPHAEHAEQEGFSPALIVWCGVCAKAIVGPFFFLEKGNYVWVTATRYHSLLEDYVVLTLASFQLPPKSVVPAERCLCTHSCCGPHLT